MPSVTLRWRPAFLVTVRTDVDDRTAEARATCNATDAFVIVTVTQKAGSGVARGTGFTSVGCTGSSQDIVVRVPASAGKTFKQGPAVVTAEISGCGPGICGSETDSETIEINR